MSERVVADDRGEKAIDTQVAHPTLLKEPKELQNFSIFLHPKCGSVRNDGVAFLYVSLKLYAAEGEMRSK